MRPRAKQFRLFGIPPALPNGFRYQDEFITPEEEAALVGNLHRLPFREFEFHGFTGRRRVVSYGWRYDFEEGGLRKAGDIPPFLLPARDAAARFAGIDAGRFQHALVTEYAAGAAIGWHRDKDVFGEVAGLSLLARCAFRLRRRNGAGWERTTLTVEPRSVYLLAGAARTEWEHSIPPVAALRYSITFRNLRAP
jgi:alkylated DNA repair dioxygenase AlkB